jgi:glucose-6-phosphate-specific signal transduction histidine kinase
MEVYKYKISWCAQIIASIIFAQTLFFKFSASPESVDLFTKIGIEPFGRYIAGIFELFIIVLLLSNRYAWLGALLGMGMMAAAIMAHLTVIGIESNNDNGLLFYLAIGTLLACSVVAIVRKSDLIARFYLFL